MTDEASSPAVSAAEQKEIDRVAKLTDAQVLTETGHGKFGPGLVGKPLAARAKLLLVGTDGGKFGPAITDPDYAKKQAAARAAAVAAESSDDDDEDDDEAEKTGPVDPADLKDPRNPWSYVTLSGAKILAQEKQVSHTPGIKRKELIAKLQAAGVVPPEIPKDEAEDDKPE